MPSRRASTFNRRSAPWSACYSNTATTSIIFSHDTDLAPTIELIARLRGGAAVETVSWKSHEFKSRLRPVAGVYHHAPSGLVFDKVQTPINDAYKGNTPNAQ
jgi:uncharacterized LabA/DUF88 family protein